MSATLPLPRNWKQSVKSAFVQVAALARVAMIAARAEAVSEHEAAVEVDRRDEMIAKKDLQIKLLTARLARVPSANRPRYEGQERLEILQLRAACGWSFAQTAKKMLVAKRTIMCWNRCLRDDGTDGLLETSEPVNRFPDLVRQIVQILKQRAPMLGKVKIAEMLCRAGLHLAVSTVGRIVKEPVQGPQPEQSESGGTQPAKGKAKRVVTAKEVNDVWNVDLTVVPTGGGFSVPWFPFTLPQCFPFCWWVAIVVDHFSRRVIGFRIYFRQPSSEQIRHFLGQAMHLAKAVPKYLICDRGPQFDDDRFRKWCRRKGIKPRYGAVGQHGSIAIVERFIKSLKDEGTRRSCVPYLRHRFRAKLSAYIGWFHEHRPHMSLQDRTPDEVYFKLPPANEQPRYEPREKWPDDAMCAGPVVPIQGRKGCRLALHLEFVPGQPQLPIVTLRAA